MKKITQKQVDRLTPHIWQGRRKSPYIEECSKLKRGEMLFISRKEWEEFGYKKGVKPFNIIGSAVYQNRKGHRSQVAGMKFSVKQYKEGWVTKRIK